MVAVAMLAPVGAQGARQRWAVCGTWRQVPIPERGTAELRDVAVVSSDEAWAVGGIGAERYTTPLVLRWDGQRWVRTPFPVPPAAFDFATANAVEVVGPSNVWVVGTRDSEGRVGRPFAARWDGEAWRLVPLGLPTLRGSLDGLAVTPGTHRLWAVGQEYPQGTALVLRWNGRGWHRFLLPRSGADRLDSLASVVAFPRVAWAVGSSAGPDGSPRVLSARWTQATRRTTLGPAGVADAIAGRSPARLWAVGGTIEPGSNSLHPAVFRRDGVGWRPVFRGRAPGILLDVVTPAPGIGWAVGVERQRPLVARRLDGGWRRGSAPSVPGWFEAIDGTPHNLWVTHGWLAGGGEPTGADTYHRC